MRTGPVPRALLGLTLLCCILGVVATAAATTAGFSTQGLAARRAVQQAKLTGADTASTDFYARSVAISVDTALIGAPWHDLVGTLDAGATYVFVRSGRSWIAQAELTATDGAKGDRFGNSVAVSGDTALVGAPNHDLPGKADAGAAYVFVRSGGSWIAQAKLTAADGADTDLFGNAVALSGDTALVGAPYHDIAGKTNVGAAYVFTRSGGSWTQQAQLTAADGGVGDQFGGAVAVSGPTAVVGAARRDTAGQLDSGAAYVFARTGTSWTQQAEPVAADGGAEDLFGQSVAVTGGAALIGAPRHDTAGMLKAGAAYVFARTGASWGQQDKLIAADGAADDTFGASVAVSAATWLIGASALDTSGPAKVGAAYVFVQAPSIARLSPGSAKHGAVVTIIGKNLGATRNGSVVLFGSAPASRYVAWSDTRLKCRVPAKARHGRVQVTVSTGGGVSNARTFTLRP